MQDEWLEKLKVNDQVIIRQGQGYFTGVITYADDKQIHVKQMQFNRAGRQINVVKSPLPTPQYEAQLLEPTDNNFREVQKYHSQKTKAQNNKS